jgi:hypothetical protein
VLDPGTYAAHPNPGSPSMTWTITVPAGWIGYDQWAVFADVPAGNPGVFVGGPSGSAGIPADSCAGAGTPPAESVDEIIETVQARDDWTVSAPVDVEIGGYAGTRIDLQLPADLGCANDDYMVIVEDLAGEGFHAQEGADRFTLWVVDAAGDPMVFFSTYGDESNPEQVAQAEDIVTTSVLTP